MTPTEVFVYLNAVKQPLMYGDLSEDDVSELLEMRGNGEGFI